MLAQEDRRLSDEIFQSARSLQGRSGSHYGKDDHHHINRCAARLQSETIDQHKDAEHTENTQSDSSHPCANKNHRQHDCELKKKYRCRHEIRLVVDN